MRRGIRKSLISLSVLVMTFSASAALDHDVPNNGIKFGDGGIVNSKRIEFSMGLGTSNPIFNSTDGTSVDLNVPMAIGSSAIDASALFQMNSTTQGFVPPRMTTVERDLIGTPIEGLTVFNTVLKTIDTYISGAWVALNSLSAPPPRNFLINSDMDLNQRGNALSNSSGYLFDRFVSRDSSSAYTISRQTAVLSGKRYKARLSSTGAANGFIQIGQQIEFGNFKKYTGKEVTAKINLLALNANAGSTEMNFNMYCNTAEDLSILFGSGAGTTNDVNQTFTSTTSSADYTFTFTIPANCKSMFLQVGTDSTIADTNIGDGFDLDWFMVYGGDDVEKEYELMAENPIAELALAQYYYEKTFTIEAVPGASMVGAHQFLQASTPYRLTFPFKVRKRVTFPTITIYAPATGAINNVTNRSAADANQACGVGDIGPTSFSVSCNLTANNHYAIHYTVSAEF